VRVGPGPVFVYEWLTTTRRWQLYALRSGFVAVILLGMIVVWRANPFTSSPQSTITFQMMAAYGETLYKTIVVIELTLVLLAAPAATAGAICLDKARGTLDHMLATDLSNAEIVLGKLGVRLIPVFGLIACVLPVMALSSLLGGIDPIALIGSFLTAFACALLACSLALTISIWGRKTHEVLMITYLIIIIWQVSPFILAIVADLIGIVPGPAFVALFKDWILLTNPYYLAYAPYTDPGKVGLATYLAFLAACLGGAGVLLILATRQVRKVALRDAGKPFAVRPRARLVERLRLPTWGLRLPGPSLDGNPILWREWHRSRPSRLSRIAWALYSLLGLIWFVASFKIATSLARNQESIALMTGMHATLGLLLLSVCAATSLAEERVRGTLDVILCTPLSSRSILIGKWWGSCRSAIPVLVWTAILAGLLVMQSGYWIRFEVLLVLVASYAAAITSLGVLAATWVSRIGRAVALCVSCFVIFAIGWLVLVVVVLRPNGPGSDAALPLLMGSPITGTSLAALVLQPEQSPMPEVAAVAAGAIVWTIINLAVAFFLFAVALSTFDLCLGRMSETPSIPGRFVEKGYAESVEAKLDRWLAARTQPTTQAGDELVASTTSES
jgi:ABC-type transport system involved in multi-copper enzyme maturation permease subunit